MRRLILLSLLPTLLSAEWIKFTSGPFEILTDAGPRAGRETMVRFLEFRHAVGTIVGEPDLQTPLPIRILVLKNARAWTLPAPLSEGRASYNIVLPEKSTASPDLYRQLTRLFLQANTAQMPLAIERGLVLIAGLWFVNLVNFMDGLDLMTVVEAGPVTATLVLVGLFGALPLPAVLIAAALCGALLGFAPFNRPVAKVFLGDVGSLPIGLLLGWCLLHLAWRGHMAAALLLPLYYLVDSSWTLLRRMLRGEPFWAAHRTHFYQRATDNGFTVTRVISEVFVLNLVLAALAIASVELNTVATDILLLIAGAAAVAIVLRRFSRSRILGRA
jgi:hypothetical protein